MTSKSRVTDGTVTTGSRPENRYGGVAAWDVMDYLLTAVLVVCTFGLLMWLMREPIFSDDLTYFEYAEQLALGNLPRPDTANVYRLGFIYSIMAAQFVFGYSDNAYHAVAIGYSLGLIAAFYALNRVLLGRSVALAASVLLITNPIFLSQSTILGVDLPALFWFMLALLSLCLGLSASYDNAHRRSTSSGNVTLWFVLAGALLFISYWIKEGIVVLLPALPIVVMFLAPIGNRARSILKALLVTGGTFLTLLLFELLLYLQLYGDAFIRISKIMGGHVAGSRAAWIESGLVADDLGWTDLLLRYPRILADSTYGLILLALVVAALFLLSIARDRGLLALGSLGLIGWLVLTLTVTSVDPLVPLLRTKGRYLSAPLVPLFSVVAGSVVIGSIALSRRFLRTSRWSGLLSNMALAVVVIGVSTVGIAQAQGRPYYAKNGAKAMTATREIVNDMRDSDGGIRRIFSDVRTLRGVRMYVSSSDWSALEPLDSPTFDVRSPEEFIPGDMVILNRNRLLRNANHYQEQLPEWVRGPPANWIEAVRTSHPNISVYYVTSVAEVAGKDSLIRMMHAYHHGPEEQRGEIGESLGGDTYEVRFEDAEDIRIVTGPGPYHLPPDDPLYPLAIERTEVLFASVAVDVKGDARVKAVTAWSLGDNVAPTSVRFERRILDEDNHQYVGTVRTDPTDGYEYLRIMMQVSGSGEVEITNLKVDRLKNSDDLPVAIFPSEPGPVTGGS